jgi:LPLT family lysophospholipid transporter-like MFS transporter
MMLFGSHPLLAYAVVGLGAAAYSPAKYGILTELLPPSQLVKANGWIEGLTIASIILGVLLGGQLVGPRLAPHAAGLDLPGSTPASTPRPRPPSPRMILVYIVAALFNLRIPRTGAPLQPLPRNPLALVRDFWQLQRAPVARQAGPDLAGHHHAVLGRVGNLRYIVLAWARRRWATAPRRPPAWPAWWPSARCGRGGGLVR